MSYASQADLGGREGHWPVVPEPEGELFHAPWEPKVFALTLAMGATGEWTLDFVRSVRETLPGYASLSYYEIWFEALEKQLTERHLVEQEELAAGRILHPARALPRVLQAAEVGQFLARRALTLRPATAQAIFTPGETVRMRHDAAPHHTRLPGYARGALGRIERVLGVHVFPDTNAQGQGEQPQWLYTVAFDARELWGPQAREGHSVTIDAWEPYLERAP